MVEGKNESSARGCLCRTAAARRKCSFEWAQLSLCICLGRTSCFAAYFAFPRILFTSSVLFSLRIGITFIVDEWKAIVANMHEVLRIGYGMALLFARLTCCLAVAPYVAALQWCRSCMAFMASSMHVHVEQVGTCTPWDMLATCEHKQALFAHEHTAGLQKSFAAL
eukprot:scaffold211173_cov20-Tisochrysis_lutea.AAC.1